MSVIRRAAKRDKNEKDIVDALRTAGASVEFLSKKGVPDLLVGFAGTTHLMEVKSGKGKLTEDEATWIREWRGTVHIVRSIEEALEVIGR